MPLWVKQTAASHRPGWLRQNHSLLQLALTAGLVATLLVLGMQQLLPLRGDAEQAQILTVTGGLQSALGLNTAERVLASRDLRSLQELHGSNPMELLEAPPLNYRSAPPPAGASSGHWYFLPEAGELAYRVRYPQYLCSAPQGPVTLRWAIEVRYQANGQPRSVRLAPLNPTLWICEQ